MKCSRQTFSTGRFWVPDLSTQGLLRPSESTSTVTGCSNGVRVPFAMNGVLDYRYSGRASMASELRTMKASYACGGFTLQ